MSLTFSFIFLPSSSHIKCSFHNLTDINIISRLSHFELHLACLLNFLEKIEKLNHEAIIAFKLRFLLSWLQIFYCIALSLVIILQLHFILNEPPPNKFLWLNILSLEQKENIACFKRKMQIIYVLKSKRIYNYLLSSKQIQVQTQLQKG